MNETERISDLSTREFCDRIADPDQFSGGGAVAAVTAASATSIALLVSRLNDRRRRPAPDGRRERSTAQALSELAERFFRAADRDLAVLDELLNAQRAMRADDDRLRYANALRAATEEPLRLSADIALLLEIVRGDVPGASRFTVSDLGAAATLAQGAARAALLTARVNVALLRDEPGAESVAGEFAAHIEATDAVITRLANEIVEATMLRIDGGAIAKRSVP